MPAPRVTDLSGALVEIILPKHPAHYTKAEVVQARMEGRPVYPIITDRAPPHDEDGAYAFYLQLITELTQYAARTIVGVEWGEGVRRARHIFVQWLGRMHEAGHVRLRARDRMDIPGLMQFVITQEQRVPGQILIAGEELARTLAHYWANPHKCI